MLHSHSIVKTYSLQTRIDFGKKHVGETIEHVVNFDIQYIEWCVKERHIKLDRWAALYLSANKSDKNQSADFGVLDYGSRDVDEFNRLRI